MVADDSEDLETRICQLQRDLSAVKTEPNPWATLSSIAADENLCINLCIYPDYDKRVNAEAELIAIAYQNHNYWDKAREAIKQGKDEQLKTDEQFKYQGYQGCLAPSAACLALGLTALYGIYKAIEHFF